MNKNQNHQRKLIFVVVLLLIFSNIFLLFSYFGKNTPKKEDQAQYSLLNPARKFYKKENLIINIQPLRDQLNEIGKDKDISIYFEVLSTGANISVNKDNDYFPASLLKLPVAMVVAKKIDMGEWKWNNELVMMRPDKDESFGTLYQQPIGTHLTIEELTKKMLIDSDNTAYRIFLRNLEPYELQSFQDHVGLHDFLSEKGNVSAKRYAVLLRSLYNSAYVSDATSQKILDLMSISPFSQYLQSGFPPTLKFSHKIGISNDKQVFLDAGIAYVPEKPFLIIVMIQGKDEQKAKDLMKSIAEKVYSYIIHVQEAD